MQSKWYLLGESLGEKTADLAADIAFHLPKIRKWDTAAGAAVGAGLGAGMYGLKKLFTKDKKNQPGFWSHLLGGAGLGAIGGNIVGDRGRRYLANNLAPRSYNDSTDPEQSPLKHLWPSSVQQVWDTAIRDVPNPEVEKQMTTGNWTEVDTKPRIELLRRHLGLPVRPETALFEPLGVRPFTPTATSGGIAGDYETYRFNADNMAKLKGWKSFKNMAYLANPDGLELIKQHHPDVLAHDPDAITNPYRSVFATHGTEPGTQSARIFDHWDFGLTPQEESRFRRLLTSPEEWSQPAPAESRGEGMDSWDGSGTASNGKHLATLAQRMLLNNVLGDGGVVVDDRVHTDLNHLNRVGEFVR